MTEHLTKEERMTLGRLVLETARGGVKERVLTQEEAHEIHEALAARSAHEPESEQVPSAWIKGHTMHTDAGMEYDEEVVPGSNRPPGNDWCPLYSHPSECAGCEEFVRMQKELCELIGAPTETDSLSLHDSIKARLAQPPPVCQCISLAPRPWSFCQDCGGRITSTKSENYANLNCSKCPAVAKLPVVDGYAQLTPGTNWNFEVKTGWLCPACSASGERDE